MPCLAGLRYRVYWLAKKFVPVFLWTNLNELFGQSCIIAPHCSWVPYLQIYLLGNICNPQVKTVSNWVICGHEQNGENVEWSDTCFSSEVKQGDVLCFCFSSHNLKRCPSYSLLNAMFFAIEGFLLPIMLYKIAPCIVLKCYLVFLSSRRLCEKMLDKGVFKRCL